MSAVTSTYKVQDVLAYVQRQFGDESGVQVTQADIIRWINLGQNEIYRLNTPVKSTSTANLVAGQYLYTFPAGIFQVELVRVNSVALQNISFQEATEYIAKSDPLMVQTGQPTMWYEYGGSFMLYPVPDTSVVGGITIFYVPSAPVVVLVSDTLGIPDYYFNRLCEYVMSQAYELDENFQAASVKVAQFSDGMNSLNETTSVEDTTYPTITVLEEDA